MQPSIGLTDDARQGTAALLHTLLADEHVLYVKTRQYHWNVAGPHFSALHAFFETQYDDLAEIIDEVAERSLILGVPAPGTLAAFLKRTRLTESPEETLGALQMIANLLDDHETVIRHLREDLATVADRFGDAGTSDFLTGLLEKHEKMAWMLRAHLGN